MEKIELELKLELRIDAVLT